MYVYLYEVIGSIFTTSPLLLTARTPNRQMQTLAPSVLSWNLNRTLLCDTATDLFEDISTKLNHVCALQGDSGQKSWVGISQERQRSSESPRELRHERIVCIVKVNLSP